MQLLKKPPWRSKIVLQIYCTASFYFEGFFWTGCVSQMLPEWDCFWFVYQRWYSGRHLAIRWTSLTWNVSDEWLFFVRKIRGCTKTRLNLGGEKKKFRCIREEIRLALPEVLLQFVHPIVQRWCDVRLWPGELERQHFFQGFFWKWIFGCPKSGPGIICSPLNEGYWLGVDFKWIMNLNLSSFFGGQRKWKKSFFYCKNVWNLHEFNLRF